MPSPLGHALAGLALTAALVPRGRRVAPVLVLAVGASLAPDLDFVPGFLVGDPGRFHHGASHSVGAAALAALLGAVVGGRLPGLGAARGALVFGLAVLVHVLLDALAADTSVPYGVPLLWPLDDRYVIASRAVFLDIQREQTDAATFFWTLFTLHNARAVLLEALLVGSLALAAAALRRVAR